MLRFVPDITIVHSDFYVNSLFLPSIDKSEYIKITDSFNYL